MAAKRPLKLLLAIAYILIVVGLALTENLSLGVKLTISGAVLPILIILYILLVRLVG